MVDAGEKKDFSKLKKNVYKHLFATVDIQVWIITLKDNNISDTLSSFSFCLAALSGNTVWHGKKSLLWSFATGINTHSVAPGQHLVWHSLLQA